VATGDLLFQDWSVVCGSLFIVRVIDAWQILSMVQEGSKATAGDNGSQRTYIQNRGLGLVEWLK
jgi:hypothetical protein